MAAQCGSCTATACESKADAGRSCGDPFVPAHKDNQDWQFSPVEFERLAREVQGVTLDAACDVRGEKAFCPKFCSAKESFLRRELSGERVWANFPFQHLGPFLRHYFAEKERDPSIMGCFVVPVWRKAKRWPLEEGLQVLAQYPAGTELFTAPMPDGSRQSKGPTRWAVEVQYDPSVVMPVGREAGSRAAHTVSQGRAPHVHGVESAGGQCTPTHPRFWRLG